MILFPNLLSSLEMNGKIEEDAKLEDAKLEDAKLEIVPNSITIIDKENEAVISPAEEKLYVHDSMSDMASNSCQWIDDIRMQFADNYRRLGHMRIKTDSGCQIERVVFDFDRSLENAIETLNIALKNPCPSKDSLIAYFQARIQLLDKKVVTEKKPDCIIM